MRDRRTWSARAALALLAALPVALAAAAEAPRPLSQSIQESWSYRNGLPHNFVGRVLVSRSGYLWLGTQEGLVRFDGVRFRVFDRLDTPGLASNEITDLLEDAEGVIWVGTTHGLSTIRADQVARSDLVGDAWVSALEADGEGGLWIATQRHGLLRVRGGAQLPAPAVDGRIMTLRRGGGGDLWIGTSAGLLRWSGEAASPAPVAGVPASMVNAIREDRRGRLWVGTVNGLYRREPGAARAVPLPLATGEMVDALFEDRRGDLWFGVGRRLVRLAGGRPDAAESLPFARVLALAEDRDGSIWLGTEQVGLHRLRWGQVVTIGVPEGLAADGVWTVRESRDGAMWVATEAGLDRIEGGRVVHAHVGELGGRRLTTIFEDRDGDLWVGIDRAGLARFRRGGAVRRYGHAEGVAAARARVLLQDAGGAIWLGTSDGVFRLEGERFERVRGGGAIERADVNAMVAATDGTLWVGTTAGLARVEGGRLAPAELDGAPIRGDVTALLPEPDGTLWMGAVGDGLLRLRAGRLSRWTRREGLYEDTVLGILDDGRGQLWLSGNKGLSRVSREELDEVETGRRPRVAPAVLGTADGMRERECNGGLQPSAWRSADGRLWFPTIGGAVAVDPAAVQENPAAPPVRIEELTVEGRPVPLGDLLVLAPGTRRVDIRYTGLALSAADRIRFRHRLEGLDDAFVDAGGERVAHYTRLGPGRYRFRVVAANEAGRWGAEEAQLAFEIEPHLWERPGLQIALGVCLAALVAALVQVRLREHVARERALAARVEEEMGKVKVLTGMLPTCAWCKRVRDEQGEWHRMEDYVSHRSEARFTHGMCPSCFARKYGDGGDDGTVGGEGEARG